MRATLGRLLNNVPIQTRHLPQMALSPTSHFTHTRTSHMHKNSSNYNALLRTNQRTLNVFCPLVFHLFSTSHGNPMADRLAMECSPLAMGGKSQEKVGEKQMRL